MKTMNDVFNMGNELQKTSEEYEAELSAILEGTQSNPLYERASLLNKMAEALGPLGDLPGSEISNPIQQKLAEEIPTITNSAAAVQSAKVEVPETPSPEKIASDENLEEKCQAILNKYAQYEEGRDVIKQAYEAGVQLAVKEIEEEMGKGAGIAQNVLSDAADREGLKNKSLRRGSYGEAALRGGVSGAVPAAILAKLLGQNNKRTAGWAAAAGGLGALRGVVSKHVSEKGSK